MEKGIRGSFHICESIFQNTDCNIAAFSLQSPGGRSNAVLEEDSPVENMTHLLHFVQLLHEGRCRNIRDPGILVCIQGKALVLHWKFIDYLLHGWQTGIHGLEQGLSSLQAPAKSLHTLIYKTTPTLFVK